jgi:hypothetical protein
MSRRSGRRHTPKCKKQGLDYIFALSRLGWIHWLRSVRLPLLSPSPQLQESTPPLPRTRPPLGPLGSCRPSTKPREEDEEKLRAHKREGSKAKERKAKPKLAGKDLA